MTRAETRPNIPCQLILPLALLWAVWVGAATTEHMPVADAGPSRYAAADPIVLDGSDSFDPDSALPLAFAWRQVAGPPVTLTDADTATPTVSGFIPGDEVQRCVLELVVSNGVHSSVPDTVELIIVAAIQHDTLELVNPPFRSDHPTIVGFGGGDGTNGGPLPLDQAWYEQVNYLTGTYFFPYLDQANALIVALSSMAPEYDQQIQLLGFSTGGNPAITVANYLNQTFRDPRYAINRITLLDASSMDFQPLVTAFNANPVAGEQAWVEYYRVLPRRLDGALNVSFPGGRHSTPADWFRRSIAADQWAGGDRYNHGLTAGYFLSVAGPGSNLQLTTDGIAYVFECPAGRAGCLQQHDPAAYPGLLPEPVVLVGPEDGATVGPDGAVLSCRESENVVSYQLLFGRDPGSMTRLVSESPAPPDRTITAFPYSPTYWTILVRDAHGSTIHADPVALFPQATTQPFRHGPRRRLR